MARTPDGPPPAPPVQKLRIRWAKRGRMRFTSHRDFQRMFERALRRAGVPVALSAGFNPHPKISYAGAAPTGTASEAEYVEVQVTRRVEPLSIVDALNASLPEGIDILDVVEAQVLPDGGTGNLPERLEASVWRIEVPRAEASSLRAAVEAFLLADTVEVQRLTKDGVRRFDARAAVLWLTVDTEMTYAVLRVVLRHGTPTVRPDDVLSGLAVMGLAVTSPRACRLAQGPLVPDQHDVDDPLAADRLGAQSSAGAVTAPSSTSANVDSSGASPSSWA